MKLRLGSVLAGVSVLCAASSAFAQEGKIQLGLRFGYAVPVGNVYPEETFNFGAGVIPGLKLSTIAADQVPIGLDVGYMVTPHILLGTYGQYGVNTHNWSNCDGCTAHDLHLGLQAQYHFDRDRVVDPWFGLGAGYESLAVTQAGEDRSFQGWQLLTLQGGVDFRTTHALTIGPFASVSFDEYVRQSRGGDSFGVHPKAIHEWITFGVKGTFGI